MNSVQLIVAAMVFAKLFFREICIVFAYGIFFCLGGGREMKIKEIRRNREGKMGNRRREGKNHKK